MPQNAVTWIGNPSDRVIFKLTMRFKLQSSRLLGNFKNLFWHKLICEDWFICRVAELQIRPFHSHPSHCFLSDFFTFVFSFFVWFGFLLFQPGSFLPFQPILNERLSVRLRTTTKAPTATTTTLSSETKTFWSVLFFNVGYFGQQKNGSLMKSARKLSLIEAASIKLSYLWVSELASLSKEASAGYSITRHDGQLPRVQDVFVSRCPIYKAMDLWNWMVVNFLYLNKHLFKECF